MSNKVSSINIFNKSVKQLEKEINTTEFNSWIKPLQFDLKENNFTIYAPNSFVEDFFKDKYLPQITKFLETHLGRNKFILNVSVKQSAQTKPTTTGLNKNYTFETFVSGKSNQIAFAAAQQVAEQAAQTQYNPLFVYGGVGLGKTHLMHAIGNKLLEDRPNAKICYVHSERFVSDMVKALQLGAMNEFKSFYRNADALLIDDIQFFAGKEQSQEEFFHTFNALLDRNNQMILTCDKYPKEIEGLEERLKSRLGWGLPVVIDPPELETRAAVLLSKSVSMGISMPDDCAIYIAQRIRSNIRELEGALKRVVANARFTNQEVDLALVKDALKDLFVISAKMVSIENIQKTVAEYYNIKLSDLLSKRRSRSITRPRQMAMALTKELTNHSLPEIGEAFNGRDHTTVLHACKKILELRKESHSHEEDYRNLNRALTN